MPAVRAEAARKTREGALSVGQRRAERHGRQLAQAESAVWHHSRRRIYFRKHCRAALAGWKSLPIVTANTQPGIFQNVTVCQRPQSLVYSPVLYEAATVLSLAVPVWTWQNYLEISFFFFSKHVGAVCLKMCGVRK